MIFIMPARDANIGRYRFYGKAIPAVEVLCQQEGF
jgi:hypothetical protein